MKKLVLTLPESYNDLVEIIKENHMDDISDCLYVNRNGEIDGALEKLGLDGGEDDLVASIYLADEIEFVEEKYIWKLKGIATSYIQINSKMDLLTGFQHHATPLTESELKAHLNTVTIGVPFDAFMKEEVTL